MKNNRIIKIIGLIILFAFLIVGIPVIINECYKANSGYLTVWSGADVLGYYGSILGSAIAAITLVVTIVFTKKQIQRESYLKSEDEKWAKIENVFSDMLVKINPINTLLKTMDNGLTDPTKAINILQKYQMNCKIAGEQLNAHLNIKDFQKVESLIKRIAEASEEFDNASQLQIEQYTVLRNLRHRDIVEQMIKSTEEHPDCFTDKDLQINMEIIEQTKNIRSEDIENELLQHKLKVIHIYETTYKPLLKLKGATFEKINDEIQQNADSILRLRRK